MNRTRLGFLLLAGLPIGALAAYGTGCEYLQNLEKELDAECNDAGDNPCMIERCHGDGGVPPDPLFADAAVVCTLEDNKPGFCNGQGKCIECEGNSDCNGKGLQARCNTTTKRCMTCDNGVTDPDENLNEVDCGGPCGRCVGETCSADAGTPCANNLYCADGVCCNQACTEKCRSCNLPGHVGQCTNVEFMDQDPAMDPNMSCVGHFVCNGNGECKKATGKSCNNGLDCVGNICSGRCSNNSTETCNDNEDCTPGDCGNEMCLVQLGLRCNINTDCFKSSCLLAPHCAGNACATKTCQ